MKGGQKKDLVRRKRRDATLMDGWWLDLWMDGRLRREKRGGRRHRERLKAYGVGQTN